MIYGIWKGRVDSYQKIADALVGEPANKFLDSLTKEQVIIAYSIVFLIIPQLSANKLQKKKGCDSCISFLTLIRTVQMICAIGKINERFVA